MEQNEATPLTAEKSAEQQNSPGFGERSPEALLEFDRVLGMLAGHTRFSLSRELAMGTVPAWLLPDVLRLQDETAEARLLLDTAGDIGLGGLRDPIALLRRAGLDGVLRGEELTNIASALDGVQAAAVAVRSMSGEVPLMNAIADRIGNFTSEVEEISSAIGDSGEVLDSASPALGRLRRRVATSYNRLLGSLEKITASSDVSPALQSDAIATRGDRLVLEVRSDQRKSVPGIVHDVSNTGATVFIEPLGVVELGNTWRETAAEVTREEERILRKLSALIGGRADEAIDSVHAAAELDVIMARGRLATSMQAARVEAIEAGGEAVVSLIDARHPLLGTDAVPATIYLGPGFSVLVITGPNAGGKTVALKNVGLLALMHQSGMQLPASADSRLAVFGSVFADIGDAQSIERSVSTFSSHMGAVIDILKRADSNSLVLLDELGTGTDPEEGAALARAVIEELSARKIPAVITTHHRGVAEFAIDADGIENASMELSPETMLPTYHLVMGLPGRSYAITVAEKLGLPKSVLERAQSLVGSAHIESEELLTQLQAERKKLAELATEAEGERSAAETARREIQLELVELRRRQDDIAEETRFALRHEADELRNTLRRIERDARQKGHHEAARRAADEARRKVRDPNWTRSLVPDPPISESVAQSLPEAAEEPQIAESLEVGDVVELRGLGAQAEVLSVSAKGTVELLIGGATARLDMSEVRRLEGVKIGTKEGPSFELSSDSKAETGVNTGPISEIDLRGRRAHEVHDAVMEFLDRMMLQGAMTCRIIHGKGTGALREAVRETLSHHDSVETFFAGGPGDGGDGATMVELK
ncbi:MAG: Smr/MutS family protein [Chloroflexi bacterium]|nr:Smr/MutS family protein [Chloroflexota bacterium]